MANPKPRKKASGARSAPKTPQENPPEAAQAFPGFQADPDGHIRWKMGSETYILRPLTAGERLEMDWRWSGGSMGVLNALKASVEEGSDTEGELDAEQRLASVRQGRDANNDWLFGWYERLFEIAEVDHKTFPVVRHKDEQGFVTFESPAQAWLFAPKLMGYILEQLVGPLPPGVI